MSRLDVDQVLAAATEEMLRHGEHAPLVFVATTRENYRLPITSGWSEDSDARAKTLFLLGRSFGQQAKVTEAMISAVWLVMEVWAVDKKSGEPAPASVEEHPNHREGLSVWELRRQGQRLEQTIYVADILREGGVVDLGPRQKLDNVETALLTSFFAGVGSARLLSDAQLLQQLQQDMEGH